MTEAQQPKALGPRTPELSPYLPIFFRNRGIHFFHDCIDLGISERLFERLKNEAECEREFLTFLEPVEEFTTYEQLPCLGTDNFQHIFRLGSRRSPQRYIS